jgi:hypothetical protein
MICKISGSHGGGYEECLLGHKNPVRTSQETHYVSAKKLRRLMPCKIWGFHGGDYKGCHRLWRDWADVSEECIASIIRVKRFGELRTAFFSLRWLLVIATSSLIIFTLMMEAIRSLKLGSYKTHKALYHRRHSLLSESVFVCSLMSLLSSSIYHSSAASLLGWRAEACLCLCVYRMECSVAWNRTRTECLVSFGFETGVRPPEETLS